MKSRISLWVLLPLVTLILSACSVGKTTEDNLSPEDAPQSTEIDNFDSQDDSTSTPVEHIDADCADPFKGINPTFRTDGWDTNFCLHSIDYDDIFSGGPPRDGIPPLDAPQFETVQSADAWIEDLEPVIIFELDGIVRAYPLQILTWHEIVNDEVGGSPIAVTFCPLCNTALVFQRPTIDGETLTFGTSGNLRYSDLVMWDRQTESWWQQFNGEAIVGDLTGTRLELLPSAIISWADFKDKFPAGEVLSIETGFMRSYGRNPYSGYDNINSFPFAYTGNLDGQLPPMARVLGIQLKDEQGGAFSLEMLMEKQILNQVLGETPIAIFWKAGTASALDSGSIADGRDIGTTGVFDSRINGQALTFISLENGTFLDQETKSTWDILGEALEGPLAGSRLVPLPHHDTFWFAWAAFVPTGSLVE